MKAAPPRATKRPLATIRVGLWGRLGSGNYGNDGTFEALVGFLQGHVPQAGLDCLCTGPEVVAARYGMPAADLHWDHGGHPGGRGPAGLPRRVLRIALGALVDGSRTVRWVSHHSMVIVPGTGILEGSLPVRPWQGPWVLFCLSLAGRLHRVPVVLLSVGASPIRGRLSRWLTVAATRMATHRTYRDEYSRDVMQQMGAGAAAADRVFPDMAFALPLPPALPDTGDTTVGVGVMAWYGANSDRRSREALHERYVSVIREFLTWLLTSGYQIRLFTGDDEDNAVAERLRADVLGQLPDADTRRIAFEPVSSLTDLMAQVSGVRIMVGARYHNVVCGLRCAVPTIATAYSDKHRVLMESFEQGAFCLDIRTLDAAALRDAFRELDQQRARSRAQLRRAATSASQDVFCQFQELAATLRVADGDGRPPDVP
ncbi:MAG TPA: polysaccharide pyruvyl transferase family protein [Segeticoccus sp.]|jgi:polysaccharide pyruvyl transferase WcaK-like protein|nr:polysaccharide pyruvyl transferase family protein [Segeticoccus sp.]